MSRIAIIIPALNEAATITRTLERLQPMRQRECDVIVIDGGSVDATVTLAAPLADKVLVSQPGRAQQLQHGVLNSSGAIIWFLHADTLVPVDADKYIETALIAPDRLWGRFNVRLDGSHPLYRLIAWMMNQRSCLTGICTGDQGIFVERRALNTIAGVPQLPLMEDIELSKRLGQLTSPVCVRQTLVTSSRRWQTHGILRTVCLMWYLRAAYALGIPAHRLAKRYR